MSAPLNLLQDVSIFKPVVLAGLNAILPVFAAPYTDETGAAFEVQLRGAFSTERRRAPNVVVSYKAGGAVFGTGQSLVDFDEDSGLFKYGFYMLGGTLRYAIQARNELEREWLIDTLVNAFTALVFVDPRTGVPANNNLIDYLGSQGVVVTGWDPPEYSGPVGSDLASPRPEGQVWEAVLPMKADVSLTYYLPGVSTAGAVLTNSLLPDPAVRVDLPWAPLPTPPRTLTLP